MRRGLLSHANEQDVAALSNSSPEISGDLDNTSGCHSPGTMPSGNKLVPHLTDSSCMVEAMPPDAVLDPG